jgi:hypothetical protein
MNLNDMQHVAEHDLQRRVEVLEDRVAWLQDALVRLLGEPDRRHLVRTALPQAAAVTPARGDSETEFLRTQPLATLAAAPAAPAPARPVTMTPPAPAAAIRKPAVNLGITAAFETLDLTLAAAASAESAGPKQRKPEAPMFELNPELLDTGRLLHLPRKLEVRAALEERYPSIMQNLVQTWRTPDSLAYLRRLIREDQGGRLGFDPLVKQEILLLGAIREADH